MFLDKNGNRNGTVGAKLMDKKEFVEPQINTIEGLTAKLFELNQKLVNEETMRNKIIEDISHDLRAPLTCIRSAVDCLLEIEENRGFDIEEVKNLSRVIDTRLKTLEVLVSDLYYLTTLDNPNNKFILECIPIRDFIEDYYCNLLIDERFENRKMLFESSLESSCLVKMDVSKITRVLDNLMTNALKYSNVGDSILIKLYVPDKSEVDKCVSSEVEERYIALKIEDTGIGIAPDLVDKVFDRMFVVSDSRTPNTSTGSGLGLSIVKEVVDKHNGKIICESELNKGSSFTIYLKEE